MLCRTVLVAVSLVVVSLAGVPSRACTSDKYLCEPNETGPAKPLLFEDYVDRIFNRKPSPEPLAESTVKQDGQRPAPPARKSKVVTPPAAAISSRDGGAADVPADLVPADLVPIVVRTTSEIFQGATSVSVISPAEWNEIDRLAGAQDAAPQPSTEGNGSAERAAAIIETPQKLPPAASSVLELVLMTFSGALAAVTALRLFAT